ncbi:Delta(24(24(1)))-sterol reductase [Mytilinidion resinicola]|uniref:Delta(24(24(1)))-sterol reductase n=1 Tax=Mytilinidion resinicola TaxID=574789 RepID=A0A6A6YF79_9PEZI|nr:Delta(24(24(1)))-sterol reductase [Mytilinidion resinicola]KAF2807486.1 Delta(24(24(1)))-sterol reductase [Mytilinidion resinicola]
MSERVTRSRTGKTPSKPSNPGFVETPGRRKSSRKSMMPSNPYDSEHTSPQLSSVRMGEPLAKLEFEKEGPNKVLSNGNGYANGHANGHANGYANGHANGEANGHTNGYANGHANGNGNGHANGNGKLNGHAKSAETALEDPKIDTSGQFEFGGSWGTGAAMIGFPSLMYYMWVGATYYDGKFPTPVGDESITDFLYHMGYLVKTGAFPHAKAWAIYWVYFIAEAIFYLVMPGIWVKGKPLPHLGGKQLDYYCSGMWSWYSTIAIALALHYSGLFKLYTVIDEFGPILSVAIISGFGMSIVAYFSAIWRGATHRMTGYPIYDFFMGAELNPRMFGILDFKMFFEVRIPWYILFLLTLGTAMRQVENYGFVSGEVCLLLLAHFLYANACAKAEHLIVPTWDMYYEKWGFMLIFWNLAGVPLSYCHCTLYLANHPPSEYHWPTWAIAAYAVLYLGVYYVWDTCNSQKNVFRQEEAGYIFERKTFPYFRYGRIANPVTIPTKFGNSLFCDGWYGKARKVHYTCDLFFALSWGLVCGFKSPFPWFYPTFFFFMISHRAWRDLEKCQERYGEAWNEYRRRVPYIFIPYVF